MSAEWVIDSSIAIAWVHPDQATPETAQLLEQVERGSVIIVPGLWFLETANSLLVLQWRKRITGNERKSALEKLLALNIVADHPTGNTVFHSISELAQKHTLTVYDATYLELAIREKLPLATRDDPLQRAARNCGVKAL